ncbi:MAG: UDP-glucose/GDP-mannose dehydrogenase family protein [candidate division WWE3 bacterium]|nr:UDP-glucose/GDP-mannose dehydrogenase family protein [candidate division WWE3 bacterium]
MSSENAKPTITFVGAGYVGLPWAAYFANNGHKVFAVDIDTSKIDCINSGSCPFDEPGLGEIVARTVKSGNLVATTDYSVAIPTSDVVFICVGTPADESGHADLKYLFAAATEISKNLGDHFTAIVDRSTVPPGTAEKVDAFLKEHVTDPKKTYAVVSSPEFLRQGYAVEDTNDPSRVIIGTEDIRAIALMQDIYKDLTCQKPVMRWESAELVKYASNAYLALRIVFADQLANLAEGIGADVKEVIAGAALDPRIGSHFWYPGLGYGGYCFPKDVKAIASVCKDVRPGRNIFSDMDELNTTRISNFKFQISNSLGGLKGKKIAVWGLSAKPQSPDMRGSTPMLLVEALKAEGAVITAFDPYVTSDVKDPYDAVKDADALLILTEHKVFKDYDYDLVKKSMRGDVILDAKRILDPIKMKSLGYNYLGTGYGK